MADEQLISHVQAAFGAWLGPAVRVIQLRRYSGRADEPSRLDVLIIEPEEYGRLPPDQRFVYLATAGLGAYPMPSTGLRVELTMRVDGPTDDEQRELLGRRLAQLTVLPFRVGRPLGPNLVLEDFAMPCHAPGMTALAITHWAVADATVLPGLAPPVLVLSVQALYPSEVEAVRILGLVEASRRFYSAGVDWHDPQRPALDLEAVPSEPAEVALEEPMDQSANLDEVWQSIEQWLAANAPATFERLRPGAPEAEITALEAELGYPLPADYRQALQRHDGRAYLGGTTYLTIAGVRERWQEWRARTVAGEFRTHERAAGDDPRLGPGWWPPGLVPFAEDSAGVLTCLDLAPGPEGTLGQVVTHDAVEGPSVTRWASFGGWLTAFRDGLLAGAFSADSEGNLQPA